MVLHVRARSTKWWLHCVKPTRNTARDHILTSSLLSTFSMVVKPLTSLLRRTANEPVGGRRVRVESRAPPLSTRSHEAERIEMAENGGRRYNIILLRKIEDENECMKNESSIE